MMTRALTLLLAILTSVFSIAQSTVIPHADVPGERVDVDTRPSSQPRGLEITTPPDFDVRTMAEWEEIQSLVIAWTSFPEILKQIAFHAKEECEVIILASNPNSVTNYLNNTNSGGPGFDNLDNITILDEDFDSIWGRDYGAHTIYRDDVDEMMLVDWIYNRNRPADDNVPSVIAAYKGVPLYSTTEAPYDLMATGGNYMSDGMGRAFSSELILEENEGGDTWWGTQFPNHSEEEINDIMQAFMGIDEYIKMEVLPYDIIHHIDMHMKLLDEETIIFGEYPAGVADGPQIEANIEYVLDNYQSSFDTPFNIVRVQMPPENGSYPNSNGDYRTYTNMVFVNKTVLVPVYEGQYDEPALEIIQNELPGYNVVGIECNDIIPLSGAIHCITKAVGVDDPLRIVHDHLEDTEDAVNDYEVTAIVQHASDINEATVHYRVDGGAYEEVDMILTNADEDLWTAYIPAQVVGSVVDYYIHGEANSGKQQVRPIVAPDGTWTFEVLGEPSSIAELEADAIQSDVYPNPASAITVVNLEMIGEGDIEVALEDYTGRKVLDIYSGATRGAQKWFFDAAPIPAGAYLVTLRSEGKLIRSHRLMVR